MEATVLFLVLYLCHRRSSWGPAIPGFDGFLTFFFPKRIFFAFMKIPFKGEEPAAAAAAAAAWLLTT